MNTERIEEPENVETMGLVIACDELSVRQWHPDRDGKGKAEQVHIVAIPIFTSPEKVCFTLRLKSKQAAEELVAMILEHAKEVWPEG